MTNESSERRQETKDIVKRLTSLETEFAINNELFKEFIKRYEGHRIEDKKIQGGILDVVSRIAVLENIVIEHDKRDNERFKLVEDKFQSVRWMLGFLTFSNVAGIIGGITLLIKNHG